MKRLLWLGEALVLAVALLMLCGLRFNVSESIPLGVYWQTPISAPLAYGQLVVFHVEGRSIPLAKPVRGMAGDRICHMDGTLRIRGVNYGPVLETWHGQALSAAVQADCCVTVPLGSVFLASSHVRSYDSRYYGAIPIERLQGILRPLLTW